jgi:hypothetical protein
MLHEICDRSKPGRGMPQHILAYVHVNLARLPVAQSSASFRSYSNLDKVRAD